MKHALIALVVCICALQSYAQEKTSEQLKKELENHPKQDTVRVKLIIAAFSSNNLNFVEKEKLAEEALLISRKLNFSYGEGYALTYLGFYKSLNKKESQVDSLFIEAEKFAINSKNPDLIGLTFYRHALIIEYKTDDTKKSLEFLVKAAEALQKSNNYKLLTNCLVKIANTYTIYLSNYPLAIEYLYKAINSAEKSNIPTLLISTLLSFGNLYALTGDYSNALVYIEKARVEMVKSKTEQFYYSSVQTNLGEVYRLSGRYPEAIKAYQSSIESDTSIYNIILNEGNLSDVYTRMDSLPLAFKYAMSSLKAAKEYNNTLLVAWDHGVLGRVYLKKGMADSSVYYSKLGYDNAIEMGSIEYMRDNTQTLAAAYAYKKDFANAYIYQNKYLNYRDSMVNDEVKNKTAVLQYNLDLEKKEAQISQLNQQKKSQKNFLITALIVLSLILIAAVLLLRNIRQKQKANKLLARQKQEIDTKAKELSDQKDILQQSYNNVELLGEIGRKISASLSVEKIISTVYNNINTLMDANIFGIGIYNESLKRIEFPATYENGEALAFYFNSIDDNNRFAPLCFNTGDEIIIGDLSAEYDKYIQHMPTPSLGPQPQSIIFLPLVAKEKKLGVITIQSFQKNTYTDYHLFMLRNIAIYTGIALDNAESYEKLNNTLNSLQSTQAQLIQSEKMASLGELTAGIAHEIQNPLNFVNNFSEVNKELLTELEEEIAKGNFEEVKSLAKDISDNEEKINQHGKRADSIVKGMLQHSRSSTGKKESVNINTLADEYLRLAYHGLRAKDKSFNATLNTKYAENIGNINIIPQDMGRVILNLITNAFYTVTEKKQEGVADYQPTVTVETRLDGDMVQVRVSDNGNGIPPKVLEKIFQPFFTTKPTGKGTGLGLSMSYEIVTNTHQGTLSVETKQAEGTTFIISLPK